MRICCRPLSHHRLPTGQSSSHHLRTGSRTQEVPRDQTGASDHFSQVELAFCTRCDIGAIAPGMPSPTVKLEALPHRN